MTEDDQWGAVSDGDHYELSEPEEPDRIREVAEWVLTGRCVLFDFDGPLCRLFPKGSSEPVARELREIVDRAGEGALLSCEARESIDPHVVLRAVDRERRGSRLVQGLEALITMREKEAATRAWPTPAADAFVRGLSAAGVRIAVTTNNSPAAVTVYLRRVGLAQYFGDHVYGRTGDPRLMKPHPDCLNRAREGLDARADDAVLIGDTVADLLAAREAEVRFVGYARNERKAAPLQAAGADLVVRRLTTLSEAIAACPS
ncbi:HAD family hydrolase [Streptomyces sp. NPDC051104]|uniref:HAD family hydrolase n=1 Tax=Streptomyces sp. NPDC051104 TaxID=3155044 RepID=UPI003422AE50